MHSPKFKGWFYFYVMFSLCIHIVVVQILGAAWYLLSIQRQATCWKAECHKEFAPLECVTDFFDCGTLHRPDRNNWQNITVVFSNCDPSNDIKFTFGIFADALTKNVVSSPFLEKYLYCLWFGLQNLRYIHSSYPSLTCFFFFLNPNVSFLLKFLRTES